MKIYHQLVKSVVIVCILGFSGTGFGSGFVQGTTGLVAPGQTFTNPIDQTIVFDGSILPPSRFVNQGKLISYYASRGANQFYEFTNYGTADIWSIQNSKIVNQVGGILNIYYYIHFYGADPTGRIGLTNYGTVNFLPSNGGIDYLSGSDLMIRGCSFVNRGIFRFDTPVQSLDDQDPNLNPAPWTFTNFNKLEVTSRGSLTSKALQYSQIYKGGVALIDGVFTAGSITIDNGFLGGKGIIKGVNSFEILTSIISPGSGPSYNNPYEAIGKLTVDNDLDLSSMDTVSIEIASRGNGKYDQLVVNGNVILGSGLSVLSVTLGNWFTPQVGDSFDVLIANSVNGEFNQLKLPSLPNGLSWSVSYPLVDGKQTVRLSVN